MLRVLTLNCCLLPRYLFQSTGDDNREQRAELIARMVQRYDVVLLQEVFGTSWCNQWRNQFKQVPGMHPLLTTRPGNKILDSGLITLSKYPVTQHSFHQFRHNRFPHTVIDRGFLYAQIQVGSKQVHIINTHLHPDECHYGSKTVQEYRKLQLTEILDFKAQQHADSDPWIIGGDFNDSNIAFTHLPEMTISLSQNPVSTWHQLVPYASNTTEKVEDGSCIDYVISNRPQQYSKLLENLISDHYGVEAMVQL